MVLSKRERVIRTLELEEPDKIPIHYLGFEVTGISNQYFKNSEEYKKIRAGIETDVLKMKFNVSLGITKSITELSFWNSDIHNIDPWGIKAFKLNYTKAPLEYPESIILTSDGRIFRPTPQVGTGLMYLWYQDGYFRTPEIVHEYWDKFGKPFDHINNKLNYSPQVWENFVGKLSKYLYPMATIPIGLHEALFDQIYSTLELLRMLRKK
ncbi:MAG: hypothetical protein KGD58_00615 [Candidatus Lokiarchaeota archaeon]|nr:hypothetical protein [Candidatus Lokiarchaeota archaeon]